MLRNVAFCVAFRIVPTSFSVTFDTHPGSTAMVKFEAYPAPSPTFEILSRAANVSFI